MSPTGTTGTWPAACRPLIVGQFLQAIIGLGLAQLFGLFGELGCQRGDRFRLVEDACLGRQAVGLDDLRDPVTDQLAVDDCPILTQNVAFLADTARVDYRRGVVTGESVWRAIVLYGANSATYRFAFGATLLDIAAPGLARKAARVRPLVSAPAGRSRGSGVTRRRLRRRPDPGGLPSSGRERCAVHRPHRPAGNERWRPGGSTTVRFSSQADHPCSAQQTRGQRTVDACRRVSAVAEVVVTVVVSPATRSRW